MMRPFHTPGLSLSSSPYIRIRVFRAQLDVHARESIVCTRTTLAEDSVVTSTCLAKKEWPLS